MDLPKNITQIGVQDAKCKIYVEDYVVSFLKQLNPIARDKTMAAALYGRRKEENDKTYLFVYGAGKLDFIQKETRHLSQAQRQEIERIRRQYFADYEFLGYRILDGEMVDGFFICEQEICRYIAGYAQFYENNEAMLTYMLESRQGDAAPESVDSEKYEMVKDRQEKRRAKFVQHKMEQEKNESNEKVITKAGKRGFQVTAATLLVLLFLLGLTMKTPLLENSSLDWDKLKTEFFDRKLTDDVAGESLRQKSDAEGENGTDVLKADDKLTEAVQAENRQQEAIAVSGKVMTGEGEQRDTASDQDTVKGTDATGTEQDMKQSMEGQGAKNGTGEQGVKQSTEEQNAKNGTVEQGTEQGSDEQGVKNGTGEQGAKRGSDEQGVKQNADGQATNANGGEEKNTGNAEDAKGGDHSSETGSDEIMPETKEKGDANESVDDAKQPRAYIVCKGDTLTGISIRIYGNMNHVDQICQYNKIANPDEIQIGQKILLP